MSNAFNSAAQVPTVTIGGVPNGVRAALGKCITALMFEAERHARERDAVALAQVHDAIMSARAALATLEI